MFESVSFKLKNKTIYIISPEPWGSNFVSKHHYANYLSQSNRVVFINPHHSWSLKNSFSQDVSIKNIKNNLDVIEYSYPLPKYNKLPLNTQISLDKKIIKKINKLTKVSPDLIWSFDPQRFIDTTIWKANAFIYHAVDLHHQLTLPKYEKGLVLKADLVIGVAPNICEYLKQWNFNTHFITHGADLQHFQNQNKELKLPGNNSVKVGYIGNLHKNLDYDLIKNLASKHSTVDFILVGPYTSNNLGGTNISDSHKTDLEALGNVYFIGSKPSNELINYSSKFDINLLFFKPETAHIHSNPHKLMSYFYGGGTILSNNIIGAYENASEQLISMSKSNEEFLDKFDQIVNNLSEFNNQVNMQIRRFFALENSYDNQINKIEALINKSIGK